MRLTKEEILFMPICGALENGTLRKLIFCRFGLVLTVDFMQKNKSVLLWG
jgi:hypothetical protein